MYHEMDAWTEPSRQALVIGREDGPLEDVIQQLSRSGHRIVVLDANLSTLNFLRALEAHELPDILVAEIHAQDPITGEDLIRVLSTIPFVGTVPLLLLSEETIEAELLQECSTRGIRFEDDGELDVAEIEDQLSSGGRPDPGGCGDWIH